MKGRRILLVDDEPYVISILASRLQAVGAEIAIAQDGADALELAVRCPYDLIIADYHMPLMGGYELGVHLLKHPQTAAIPILLLSARGHHLKLSELATTNIKAVIAKPFSTRELLARVEEMLSATAASGDVG